MGDSNVGVWYYFGLEDADRTEIGLFFTTVCLLAALVIVGLLLPELFVNVLNNAYDFVMHYFGWWFMLLGAVLFVFSLFMAFSRYGRIRIGGEDAEPEFGKYSWIAMVFTVGFGSSIVVWGVGEPLQIVANPPPQSPVGGASLKSLGLAFMFLHSSGMIMWYFPLALAFALMMYTRGVEQYKISSLMKGLIDEERFGWLYRLVDLTALVAMVGGLAAALGFTAQQLSTILGQVFGLQANLLTYGLFAFIGLVFLGDVWLGLRKGIRNAANGTIVLMAITMVLLLIVGPTLFTLNIWLDATGVWLSNLPRLMLYTAPTAAGDWPQQWTSFWWAWWAAWALFVGIFVARVSKGRTIREMFFGIVVIPVILVWIQHAIVGGWVLAPEYFGPVSEALANGGIPSAVAKAITLTPLSGLLGVLLVLVMAGYILTSLDSAVYMFAAITLGDEDPNARNRAWWGVLLAFLGVMTLELPSFEAMQSFSPVMGLPFTLFFVVIIYTSYVVARDHYREELADGDEESFVSFTTERSATEEADADDGGYTTDGGPSERIDD
jgi:glycine betaine transporter